jgi:ribosomal protein S6--L-glutamate ligase
VGVELRPDRLMRLFFLTVRRVPPVPSPVLVEVFARLSEFGFRVAEAIPEEEVVRADDLAPSEDLWVLKSHTELALGLAGLVHARGGRLLNPYGSCIAAQDKITACNLLRLAGVSTPRTWVTGDVRLVRPLLDRGPLIVKPHRGHRGAGVAVVRRSDDLDRVPPSAGPVVVQDLVRGPGEDLKVYVVGERVFAVRKRFAQDSFTRPGRPCRVSPEVRELALRCGEAFGLGLFGLDVIESADGPVVVDVNYFPGYKGVPDAAALIATYIREYALGRRELVPPGASPARIAAAL